MDHSLAQTIELQCPQCGARFAAAVWLIVDAGARPELLARVADGSLHTVVCPNGHGGAVDAPLLLYRPGATPTLLFSPATQTTAEQDAEMAQGLVGRLRETLGGAWRDEWLGELSPLPREALAALARGDEAGAAEALRAATAAALPPAVARALADIAGLLAAEGVRVESAEDLDRALAARPELRARLEAALRDAAPGPSDAGQTAAAPPPPPLPPEEEPGEALPPLLQALADWIETPDWLESYRFLLAHSELLTDEADALLGQLLEGASEAGDEGATRLFTEHRALLQRSRAAGAAAAFAEKMGTTAEQLEAATRAAPAAAAIPPETRRALDEIMAALAAEGVRPGSPEEFEAALAARPELAAKLQAAAGNTGRGPDMPPEFRDDVRRAQAAEARYRATSDPAALDEAAAAWERILGSAQFETAPETFRLAAYNAAAIAIIRRYQVYGQLPDLDRALALWQAAVAGTPAGSPDRAMYQSNLGNGLRARYGRTGAAADLDAAIAAWEAAVAGTPAGSPDLAGRQSNLGAGLRARYGRTGAAADLDAAIVAFEVAVAGTPAGSPDRAMYQSNLGAGLSDRYGRTGAAADLDAAIAAYETAVAGTPAGSPDLAAIQSNLGNGLRDRYARTGLVADLDAAIAAFEAAVAGTPAGSPDLAGRQSNLGIGLRDRYGRTGAAADLDAAIAAWQAAVAGTPAGSPDRAGYQSNLGTGLRDRYRRTGTAADLDAAIGVFTAAVDTLDGALLDSPVAFVIGQQSRWAGLHARAVATLVAAGRVAEALAVAEGTKSRLLAGLMGRGELPAPADLPADLVARERAAAERLRALDARELAGHVRAPGSGGDRPAVAGRTAIVDALRAIWAEMAAAGPKAAEYVALRRGDRPTAAGLARLAGALPPGTALLSIFDPAETVPAPAGEDGAWQRLLLFLWPAGAASPRVVAASLDPDARRYDYLANYEDEVLNRGEQARLGRPVTQRWRGLGVPLLGPLRPYLDGIDHLIISPERLYHQLPLHALWLSDAGDTLLDHCAVSTIPALGLLERLRGAESAPAAASGGRSAVFGYTPADGATKSGADERRVFLGEAEAVAARLGVAPLLDDAATSEGLEKATAAPLRVLHLSCHGGFSAGDALASGVRLADGVYTARRFLERRLVVDLVTLSACQTGISSSLGGDEMAGLSMALLSAGAASLLLGLWSVNAVTTALLMDDFYARLAAGGVGKAEALRRTMLAFRAGAIVPPQASFDPADAYYWAPFVLVGDWR